MRGKRSCVFSLASVAVVLFILTASSASAQTAAIQTANGPAYNFNDFAGAGNTNTVGWAFQIGPDDVTVESLGVFDRDANGLAESHPVGLWNAGGTLQTQTTILSGILSPLIGAYRYEPTAPVTLLAGQTYVLGAFYSGDSADGVLFFSSQTYAPQLSYVQARSSGFNTPYGFPGVYPGADQGVFGPNMLFVPEPASLSLLAIGATMILRRRKH